MIKRFLMAIAVLPVLLAAPMAAADVAYPAGQKHYKRCVACHLPTGAGVPGAFPPLKADFDALARSDEGRAYLVGVLKKGIVGMISVEGKRYAGAMPKQFPPLNDEKAAEVLNYILFNLNAVEGETAPKAFTAEEVGAHIKALPKGVKMAKRRAELGDAAR